MSVPSDGTGSEEFPEVMINLDEEVLRENDSGQDSERGVLLFHLYN